MQKVMAFYKVSDPHKAVYSIQKEKSSGRFYKEYRQIELPTDEVVDAQSNINDLMIE